MNFTPNSSLPALNAANTVEVLTPNVFKQGDTFNDVRVLLKRNDVPVDLNNATVVWSAAGSKGTVIAERPATVYPGGEIAFAFTEEDKGAWGTLRIEFKVTYLTGEIEKFPANDHVRLHVTRSHDDLNHTPVLFASISYFNQKVEEAAQSAEEANQRALLVEGQGATAQASGEFAQTQGEFAQEHGGAAKEIADNTKFIEPYNVTSTYKENNVVSFNGASYMVKRTTTGNAPTDDPDDLNWGLLSRKGTDGTGTVHVHKEIFEATEGQTVFTLTNTYDQFQNRTSVIVGRVPQDTPENYEETTPNSITLAEGVPAGTSVKVEYFSESIPLQSDIQTTVDNHTGVITDHTLKLDNHTVQLADIALNVKNFGAKLDGVTDDSKAVMDAHNALPSSGGSIRINGVLKIKSPLVFTKQVRLIGQGYATNAVSPATYPSTTILKDGNFDAITLSTNGSGIKDVSVVGVAGNGGDGIAITGARCFLENVSVNAMGRDGVRVGGNNKNANLFRISNLVCLDNARYGLYIHDDEPLSNVNAGVLLGYDARGNKVDGLALGNCYSNTFIAVTCQNNVGAGVRLYSDAESNRFFGTYTEMNTGGEFLLDANSKQNMVLGMRGGLVFDGIVDNGTSNFILGSANLTDWPFYIKSDVAIKKIMMNNDSISGHWAVEQNGTNRNLEIKLSGTSVSADVDLSSANGNNKVIVDKLKVGNNTVSKFFNTLGTLPIGTVPANSTKEATRTVSGVGIGDIVQVTPNSGVLPAGIMIYAYVSATDTIKIRFANVTIADIVVADASYKTFVARTE